MVIDAFVHACRGLVRGHHLGGFEWIVFGKRHVEKKHAPCIWGTCRKQRASCFCSASCTLQRPIHQPCTTHRQDRESSTPTRKYCLLWDQQSSCKGDQALSLPVPFECVWQMDACIHWTPYRAQLCLTLQTSKQYKQAMVCPVTTAKTVSVKQQKNTCLNRSRRCCCCSCILCLATPIASSLQCR